MHGEVQAVAKGGAGVVRHEGRVVFVPGALPGEIVEFVVERQVRSVLHGSLQRVLEPSGRRVLPPCPHYGACGGCNLQHAAYDLQLEIKAAILADNLRRIAGRVADAVVHPSPPFRYRTRTVFRVSGGRVGMMRRASHRVETLRTCWLVPEVVESFALREFSPPAGEDGELAVLSDGRQVSARLATGGADRLVAGPETIRFAVAGFSFTLGPGAFVQSNLFQLDTMAGLAQAALADAKADRALDLFSGAGFFTLPLAARARTVFSVENDAAALEAQQANLAANGATHVRLLDADGLKASLPRVDLAVADPPRGGLGRGLCHRLAACGARRLVYFSCDSATFARDLRELAARGFRLADLQLIDNFPQTDHFEIYSLFERV